MYRKRKKGGRHLIAISFLVTFGILVSIYGVFYLTAIGPHIDVEHLPQSIPPYTSFWARYVPADAAQFGFQNYTKIHNLNSTFPLPNTLLELVKPVENITTSDIDYFLTIVFAQPNATLDLTFLRPSSYLNFQAPLLAQGSFGQHEGNATLFNLAVKSTSNSTSPLTLGWLVLIPQDNAVGFAAGSAGARQAIEISMSAAANPTTQSILSRADVTQSLYIVGGIRDHIALGEQNFPGVVRTGQMTVTSVDYTGPYLFVKNVVTFANSSDALSHYSDVTHAYLSSQKFVVYDSLVMAQEQDAMSKLLADYRLVL